VTVVLDTNVLFAALVTQGLCRELFQLAVLRRALVSSPALMAELEGVIRRKLGRSPPADAFLRELRRHAKMVDPNPPPVPVCRDPDDDVVLASALRAKARIIVTGDGDLLTLHRHRGIRILSPRQFLELHGRWARGAPRSRA
jgi:putative PIN family toxin of toxin-antitoxin system